jgi:hypothetical protein
MSKFSDPPKSVSEFVTYVPSTLSSRSDDCCHVVIVYVSLIFPLCSQGGQVGRAGSKGRRGDRFWIFFGNIWLFVHICKFCQILAFVLAFLENSFFGIFWIYWKILGFWIFLDF